MHKRSTILGLARMNMCTNVLEYHKRIRDIDSQTTFLRRRNFYCHCQYTLDIHVISHALLIAHEFVIFEGLFQLVRHQETRSTTTDADHPDFSWLGMPL